MQAKHRSLGLIFIRLKLKKINKALLCLVKSMIPHPIITTHVTLHHMGIVPTIITAHTDILLTELVLLIGITTRQTVIPTAPIVPVVTTRV